MRAQAASLKHARQKPTQLPDAPCLGMFPRSVPPAGDLPTLRGHPPFSRSLCYPRWGSRGAGLGSSARSPAGSRCPLCVFYTKTPPWEGPRTKRRGSARASPSPLSPPPGELPTERDPEERALRGPGRTPRCGEAGPGRPRGSPGPGPPTALQPHQSLTAARVSSASLPGKPYPGRRGCLPPGALDALPLFS